MGKKSFSYARSGDGELTLNSFVEISIDPIVLNNFSTEEGLNAYFNNYASSEEFQNLKRELLSEVMNIIETCLTENQKEIMVMTYVEGKTQNEIAQELGKHQTTIHKQLRGNLDYTNNGKRYGGAIKKIKKLCAKNDKIQEILQQMKDSKEIYG